MNIKDILSKNILENKINYNEPFIDPNFQQKTATVINNLFSILSRLPAFKAQYPTQEDMDFLKQMYLKAFINAQFNDINLIERGVDKLLESKVPFCPMPAQFIELCKPNFTELGWPELETAFKEAILLSHPQASKNWSYPAIQQAVREIGSFNLTHMSEKDAKKKFQETYNRLFTDALNGKEIPLLSQFKDSKKEYPKSKAEKDWEAFRKGVNNVDTPDNGWVNLENQDLQHAQKMKEYKEGFAARGVVIPDYKEFNSAKKALLLLYKLAGKLEAKQKQVLDKIKS